jgi:aryl-alcohol dehydrogenase-like predicted oxidoreductase
MWRGATDEEGKEAVRRALVLGIDFFDTALAYGDGHSEWLLAEVLEERGARDRVVVATKIPPMDYEWPGQGTTPLARVFPPRHLVDCVEASLRNLRAQALHLEQFHVWHDGWLDDPTWGETRATMERMRRDGKVLHWGVSVNDHAPETALRVLEDPLVETAQVIYNVFDRSPERELFALARERDLGLLARVPFDEGALTGAIRPDTTFPSGDWRERYFRGRRKAQAAARADALRALLGEEARTLPELALRFCLSRPEVSTVIPGMRRAAHVEANAAVSDGRALSPALLDRLAAHAWEKNWYSD